MSKVLYRINELKSTAEKRGVLPFSSATIWRLLKRGSFPQPFRISPQCLVWDSDDIDKWIDEQKTAEYVKKPNPNSKPKE